MSAADCAARAAFQRTQFGLSAGDETKLHTACTAEFVARNASAGHALRVMQQILWAQLTPEQQAAAFCDSLVRKYESENPKLRFRHRDRREIIDLCVREGYRKELPAGTALARFEQIVAKRRLPPFWMVVSPLPYVASQRRLRP